MTGPISRHKRIRILIVLTYMTISQLTEKQTFHLPDVTMLGLSKVPSR